METISRHRKDITRALGGLLLLALAALLMVRAPHLLQKAFPGDPNQTDADAVGKVTDAVDKLDGDVLPFMVAVVPLAIVVGAISLMVGNRRGTSIIGSALGALIIVVAIKGIAR